MTQSYSLPASHQPSWLADLADFSHYGITIESAELVWVERYGTEYIGVRLTSDAKRTNRGYWFYKPRQAQSNSELDGWVFSAGTVKKVYRKALEDIIKPNFTPEDYTPQDHAPDQADLSHRDW